MKKFTKQEIRGLLNQVMLGGMSFPRMVDVLNRMVSERVSFPRMVEVLNRRVSEAEDIHEEPKKSDLAIFWDGDKRDAAIRIYERFNGGEYFTHRDHSGLNWKNSIKFESKEQYERLIKGEI